MAWSKINIDVLLVDDSDQAIAEVVNISSYMNLAIQVNYGANGGGNLTLDGSLNGVDFAEITDSSQAADVLGGVHIWNATDLHFRYLRINVPATDSTSIRLQGENRITQ